MIKLIKPIVFTIKENGAYTDKTDSSMPFKCSSDAVEADLVKRGFAEYVDEPLTDGANTDKRQKTSRKR